MATREARRVLFRADSSTAIGTGHLVRCIALALELQRHGMRPCFASRALPRSFADELEALEFPSIALQDNEVAEVVGAASPSGFSAVVTDHYGLGAAWLGQLRKLTRRSVVIDDLADRPLPANVLVNPNLGVASARYEGLLRPGTRLLLGPRYAPIRSAFRDARTAIGPVSTKVNGVFISLGGATPSSTTNEVVAAAREALPDARIDVVLGALNEGAPPAGGNVVLHRAVDAQGMARLMTKADIAIGAGGTSSWERCMLGLPTVALRLAPNQDPVVNELAAAGAAADGGAIESLDRARLSSAIAGLARGLATRAAMRTKAMALVDGRGAERLAHHVDGVRIRSARRSDARQLWHWANDPATRAASTKPARIAFDDHVRWLDERLSDPASLLLIGWNGAGPLGQVRFDVRSEAAEVSISVAPEHRGTVGGLLLESATRRFRRTWPALSLMARVKRDNAASRGLFERAGFRLAGERDGLLRYDAPAPYVAALDSWQA